VNYFKYFKITYYIGMGFLVGLIFTPMTLQGQTLHYLAPSISVARYSGEIHYDQFFFWSPIGERSRLGAGILYGSRFNKKWAIECHAHYQGYSGISKLSNPKYLRRMGSTLEGHTVVFGVSAHRHFKNGMEWGMGFHYGFNFFDVKQDGATLGSEHSSENTSLVIRVGKPLWQFRNKSEIVFRYSLIYNLQDNWDTYAIDRLSDFLTVGEVVFLVPVEHTGEYIRGIFRGKRNPRCPKF
jgi:hypothetical protein